MSGLTGTLFVVIYLGVALVATLLIFMMFLRGLKTRGALPYKPVPMIFPPIPVEPTTGVWLVGSLAIAWSVAHLGVIAYWLATESMVPQTPPLLIAGFYTSFAAMLVGAGGALLLRRRPMGRNLISWGMVLLSLLTFYGLIVSFMLPSLQGVSAEVRSLGRLIGTLVAMHLIFDVAVGAMGQRVGRPEGWSGEKDLSQQEYIPPEASMSGWEDPGQQH